MNRDFKKGAGFIPYGRQWIDGKDIRAVVKVLKSDWITQGPKVEEFEKAIAKYCGVRYGVAVSSGTAALKASYIVAGIEPGDEVITIPLTFAATANMIVDCGGKPVFVDIQEDTLNIEPKEVEKKITKRTKAIAIVDFAGHPCDLDEIKKIARKHKLLVIEDASHALGSEYKGQRIGGITDLTIFSFHPVKAITCGEGGMILTNNRKFYERLKILRHHGIIKNLKKGGWYYKIEKPGYNFRITDFQCALGISQLKKLNKFIKRRREIVAQYNKVFKNIKEVITPKERSYVKSAWHIYWIRLKNPAKRRIVFDKLKKSGIGVQVHYIPLYLQPYYRKKFGYKKNNYPKVERYYQGAITLPLYPQMRDDDVKYVIKALKRSL